MRCVGLGGLLACSAREWSSCQRLKDAFQLSTGVLWPRDRAWRGEADAAFAWPDKALAARDPTLASLKADRLPSSLRADPRWNALLRKIGLPTD
jgi:hypothetical protein